MFCSIGQQQFAGASALRSVYVVATQRRPEVWELLRESTDRLADREGRKGAAEIAFVKKALDRARTETE
jgi:hypothetical protein